jgi:phenylalanyl-tRNA synthetase beta chain
MSILASLRRLFGFDIVVNEHVVPVWKDEDKAILKALDARIIIGKVLSIRPHSDPSVTKVRVTTTDIGREIVQILCGASNLEVNDVVPVATLGTVLGADFSITKRNIRGEESCGMICSRSELGLESDGVDGIWRLNSGLEKALGQPLCKLVSA